MYKINAVKARDILPKMIKSRLEEIDPQKPKKFIISLFPFIFPIPGSLGLWVNMLINKKNDNPIN